MREATASWIKDAREEVESAVVLFDHEKYRGACYHSQQCVEKGLKALILEKGEKPEGSHDIVQLTNRVKGLGWKIDLETDEAVFLNSIYRGRYPTEEDLLPHGEPSHSEAGRTVDLAQKFMEFLSSIS